MTSKANQSQKKEFIKYTILFVLSLVACFFIGEVIETHGEVIEGNVFYLVPFAVFVSGVVGAMLTWGIYLFVFFCFPSLKDKFGY